MSLLTCLTCGAEFTPTVTQKGLTICPVCHRCIVVSDGRKAGMPETSAMSIAELSALRREKRRVEGRR